jgi:pilus assembly protein CpaE
MPGPSSPIRFLLVEDVPQVAQYVRGLLNTQQTIKLIDVVTDGSRVAAQVQQLRPDVVMVDWLLQGRTKGQRVAELLRDGGLHIPVIALTVPQNPVEPNPAGGVAAVISMPFSGFELVNTINAVYQVASTSTSAEGSRMIAVFAPKGGVGKTTIAFNLAVASAGQGRRTCLMDGSLQFGDLRSLLKVPADSPSILDLPTDRVGESDLADVLWRDPSGIDILLAPPRVELAEMVSVRDIEKVVSLLRRVYQVVVIDMPATLGDVSLSILDAADTVLEIVTYDSTTIYNTLAVAAAFRAIGYPAGKIRYVVNRADSAGGMSPDDLARALGRTPEHRVVSDGRLVMTSNNAGVPFVLADPAAQISRDLGALAADLLAPRVPAPTRR